MKGQYHAVTTQVKPMLSKIQNRIECGPASHFLRSINRFLTYYLLVYFLFIDGPGQLLIFDYLLLICSDSKNYITHNYIILLLI